METISYRRTYFGALGYHMDEYARSLTDSVSSTGSANGESLQTCAAFSIGMVLPYMGEDQNIVHPTLDILAPSGSAQELFTSALERAATSRLMGSRFESIRANGANQ